MAQLKQKVLGDDSNRYILKYYDSTVQPRSRTTRFKPLEEQMTSKWWLVPVEYVAGFYFILWVFLNLVQSTKFQMYKKGSVKSPSHSLILHPCSNHCDQCYYVVFLEGGINICLYRKDHKLGSKIIDYFPALCTSALFVKCMHITFSIGQEVPKDNCMYVHRERFWRYTQGLRVPQKWSCGMIFSV